MIQGSSKKTATHRDTAGWAGHPRGLSTLFFTEMWERFSYYGMRAFLILYMTAAVADGGLGFTDSRAASIYGNYTGGVYATAIFGGLIADRWLGQYNSVLLGGIIIALGHFSLAFKSLPFFFTGLVLIVAGTGLLKPNVSTLVGALYDEDDERRDAGFSIFYMGINLGAFIGPLLAGYLAQRVNWHVGFAVAGVGMTLGLIQYVVGRNRLKPALERMARTQKEKTVQQSAGFTSTEWKRMGAIVIFFVFSAVFWGAYEQAGSTLNLFADRYTRLTALGFSFPSSWFQSVPAIFVVLLAPCFAWLWVKMGEREPSSPTKFALGLFFVGLAFLLLVPAAMAAQGNGIRVSPWWLVGSYLVQEFGELCLSPVGLSLVTKLAPVRVVGLMMGVWFLSISAGDKLAGYAAGFFSTMPLPTLFGWVAAIALIAGFVMFLLIKPVKNMMGGVQ